MPHFTLALGPQGPLVNAAVGVSEPRAAALTASGQQLPPPVPIRALVDTGASVSCIEPAILTQLGLTPTGSVAVATAGGVQTLNQYDVAIVVPASQGAPMLILAAVPVVGTVLRQHQGFDALIGRDLLEHCVLVYNGTMKQFTLAF